MSDQFLGSLRYFSFDFAPKAWATCNGQTLSIQQNSALFALLGTFYGGNGVSTFQLPNMQSRTPVHVGQGQGLSAYVMGEQAGSQTATLQLADLPSHTHNLVASTNDGTSQLPHAGDMLAKAVSGGGSMVPQIYAPFVAANTTTNMSGQALGVAGSGLPVSVIQPYLTINCCIALLGVFPSRN
jgi:microcystin-dependent protein